MYNKHKETIIFFHAAWWMLSVRAGKGPPPKRPKVRGPMQPATQPPAHLLRPEPFPPVPPATPLPMGPNPIRLGDLRPPNPMQTISQGMAQVAEHLSFGMQHMAGVMHSLSQANRAAHQRELQLVYALGRANLDLPDFHAESDPYGAPAGSLDDPPPPSQQPASEPSAPGPVVLVHDDVAFEVEIGELQHAEEPEGEVEVVEAHETEPPQTEPPAEEEEPRRSRLRKKTPDPNWKEDQKEDQ